MVSVSMGDCPAMLILGGRVVLLSLVWFVSLYLYCYHDEWS